MASCASSRAPANKCSKCLNAATIYAIGECDHPVCYKCCTRMRVLYSVTDCFMCQQNMSKVVFTKDIRPFRSMKNKNGLVDTKFRIFFDSAAILQKYRKLLKHECHVCTSHQEFRTFEDLRRHMKNEHERYYCSFCVKGLKLFTAERRNYTSHELILHKRKCNSDVTTHAENSPCAFCEERFLDINRLLRHLRNAHVCCHLCDANSIHSYFRTFQELEEHVTATHHPCESTPLTNELSNLQEKCGKTGDDASHPARNTREVTPNSKSCRRRRKGNGSDWRSRTSHPVTKNQEQSDGPVHYLKCSSIDDFLSCQKSELSYVSTVNVSSALVTPGNTTEQSSVYNNSNTVISNSCSTSETSCQLQRLVSVTQESASTSRSETTGAFPKNMLANSDKSGGNMSSKHRVGDGSEVFPGEMVNRLTAGEMHEEVNSGRTITEQKCYTTRRCSTVENPSVDHNIEILSSNVGNREECFTKNEREQNMTGETSSSNSHFDNTNNGTVQMPEPQYENKVNDMLDRKENPFSEWVYEITNKFENMFQYNCDRKDNVENDNIEYLEENIPLEDYAPKEIHFQNQQPALNVFRNIQFQGNQQIQSDIPDSGNTSIENQLNAAVGTVSNPTCNPQSDFSDLNQQESDSNLSSLAQGNGSPLYTFIPPCDSDQRNVNLFAKVKASVQNMDAFVRAAALYRECHISAVYFYNHCLLTFGARLYADIFPDMVALLPDIQKQQDLLAIHRAIYGTQGETLLEICPTCRQVLLIPDNIYHQTIHILQNRFS